MWHFLTLNLMPLFPFLGLLWSPCCCSPGCQFFSDDFAVDDLATNYTSVSGSWSISGGTLHTTSSSGVLTGNTANPNSDSNTKVTCTITLSTSGDIGRIILDYQNSSNYWFAEVKSGGSGYLKIVQRSGGVNTVKNSISVVLGTGSLAFCAAIRGTTFTAVIDTTPLSFTGATFTQTGWGLGTGTLAGTATFDNLTASVISADCAACSVAGHCGYCLDASDILPQQFQLEVSGVASGTCVSGDCNNLNGIFIVDWTDTFLVFYDCEDNYLLPGGIPNVCAIATPALTLYLGEDTAPPPTHYNIAVAFQSMCFYNYISTSKIDCENLSGLSLPWINNGAGQCDGSASTCTITSL